MYHINVHIRNEAKSKISDFINHINKCKDVTAYSIYSTTISISADEYFRCLAKAMIEKYFDDFVIDTIE